MMGWKREVPRLLREMPGMILPVILIVGFATVALKLLGLMPPLIQGEQYQRYETVEEARLGLGIDIFLPAYFPDYLAWPPAEIVGQRRPFVGVSLIVHSRGESDEALVIRQIISDSEELPIPLPEPETLIKRSVVFVNGKRGERVLGRRADGKPYNQVYWRDGSHHLIMTTTYAVEELLKMASSMRP